MARHCYSVAHGGESSAKRKARGGGGGGVMLFGVILTAGRPPVKKSKSMGNLSLSLAIAEDSDDEYDGQRSPVTRKKAIPWTEEEHRQFLIGLQVLGKGDWLGISRNYVPSKTPSQVASHAQKYYMHLSNPLKKKRRVSVFDKVSSVEINSSMPGRSRGDDGKELMLSLSLGVYVDALELSLKPPSGPLPYQQWAPNAYPLMDAGAGLSQQQIFRPVPVTPEERINQMLRLTLGVTRAVQIEPSALSLRPPGIPMM